MKIIVVRSGGFAGLTRRWTAEPDRDEQPLWQELIDTCPWDEAESAPPQPDRYVYTIDAAAHRATLPEASVTGPWRQLVQKTKEADESGHSSQSGQSSQSGHTSP